MAEARVPYSGSHQLFSARPSPDLRFPYRGRVAVTTVALRAYSPGKDLTWFEREVQEVLCRTRDALAAFAPKVLASDANIRGHIELAVRTL